MDKIFINYHDEMYIEQIHSGVYLRCQPNKNIMHNTIYLKGVILYMYFNNQNYFNAYHVTYKTLVETSRSLLLTWDRMYQSFISACVPIYLWRVTFG